MSRDQKQKLNVGIDMGTGSIAICARSDRDVIFRKTILLDHETGALADRRSRRRMIRTRVAHKAREYWWNECAAKIGLPLLKTITKTGRDKFEISNVDDRLKREHPPAGDDTCYNGALLRIEILEGRIDQLEDWQIYKAVHNAMQKRGYDPKVPWKSNYQAQTADVTVCADESEGADKQGSNEKSDDADSHKNMDAFLAKIENLSFKKKHQFPCYFDAYQSGLWSPERGVISQRQNLTAQQRAVEDFGGYVAPRKWHQRELMTILEQVNTRFPGLDPRYVMYGPGLTPYASHPKHKKMVKEAGGDQSLKMGRDTDWHGLHGQKNPRFDNRAINKCQIFSRLSVCRMPNLKDETLPISDEEDQMELRLYPKFVFLSKLKNLRVIKVKGGAAEPLTPQEVRAVFDYFSEKLKCTKTELKKYLGTKGYKIAPGHDVDFKFAFGSGRTSYSRPALRLLVKWLYEGWSVSEARTYIDTSIIAGNTDPLKGLVKDDFKWLDALAENAWVSSFFVPHTADALELTPDEVIKSVTFPLVRHRLTLFRSLLEDLKKELVSKDYDFGNIRFGLEVIKDESPTNSFAGEKRRNEIMQRIRKNEKENNDVTKLCNQFGIDGKKWKMVKIARRQRFLDPYDLDEVVSAKAAAQKIQEKSMMEGILADLYDIDHIIPQSRHGSDGLHNLVVTKRTLNRSQKGERTPYEWLGGDEERWDAFVKKVTQMSTGSRDLCMSEGTIKTLLSTREEDVGLRQTDLQATSYIEKTAQALILSVFGYKPPQLGGKRHVVCVPGAMTARIRRKRKLDGLLYEIKDASNKSEADLKKAREDLNKKLKNRSNPCHHILDASVLTFIPEWALSPSKARKFSLPDFAQKYWFEAAVLDDHSPEVYNTEKPAIFETKKRLGANGEWVSAKSALNSWTVKAVNKQIKDGWFNHPPLSEQKSPLAEALTQVTRGKKATEKMPTEITLKLGKHTHPVKRLSSYNVFASNNHKQLANGSVIESSLHKGVVVYREVNKNGRLGTWKNAVVAAWSSRDETIRRIENEAAQREAKVELWNNGRLLTRGQKVELLEKIDDEFTPGIMTISTTRASGSIGFSEKTGLRSINKLLRTGNMKPVML